MDRDFLLSRRSTGQKQSLYDWASSTELQSLHEHGLLSFFPTRRSYRGGRAAGIRFEARTSFYSNHPKQFTRPLLSKERRVPVTPSSSLPKLGLLNACSVSKRRDVIVDLIVSSGLDFLALTETFLNITHGDHILKSACPPGYSSLHIPRALGLKKGGGGVGFIFSDLFTVKTKEPLTSPTSFEALHLSVRSNTKHVRIFVIYRPPERTDHPSFSVFMAEFRLLLESSIDISEELVIVGDFNIHVENSSNHKGTTFNQLLEDMGWIQLVKGRTHKAGHTLDLVIVRSGNSFVTEVEVSTLVSDHHLVECSIVLSRPTMEKKIIFFRNYGSIIPESFVNDLQIPPLFPDPAIVPDDPAATLSALVEQFEESRHVPQGTCQDED